MLSSTIVTMESNGNNNDLKWEQNYEQIENLEPLFRHLPSSQKQVAKVFEIWQGTLSMKGYDNNYVGPLVLAKKVSLEKFEKWLRKEWGLHKSVRLVTGTVYLPQASAFDHGILRLWLGDPRLFPVLDMHNANPLGKGSGAIGHQNPDVAWFREDEGTSRSRVLFEVGISQALPDLRRRAYSLCAATGLWTDLQYVVLVKRYDELRLYLEIWKRIDEVPGAAVPGFLNDQRRPEQLHDVLQGTMQFVANAHASRPGAEWIDAVVWQREGQPTCDIPAGEEVVAGGPTITFDVQALLGECRFNDL